MATYKYNVVLDSMRLFRAAFFNHPDPFIMTNPRAILARNVLFRWDSLSDANGETLVLPEPFATYQPFISVQPILFAHLPEQYGREAFNHMLNVADHRLKQLELLLQQDGLSIAENEPAWKDIGSWIYRHIDVNELFKDKIQSKPTREKLYSLGIEQLIAPVWQSLCVDLSLAMASKVQLTKPEQQWLFWAESGVKNAHEYGRSPWLIDPASLVVDEPPQRTLLLELISGMLNTTLIKRLCGEEEPEDIGLLALYENMTAS